MTPERDTRIQELLATAIPAPDAAPHKDWEAVLARVKGETSVKKRSAHLLRRASIRRAGVALTVAAAAIFAAVLFWPSAGKHSVLDRALAAIGDGPIIHVVYRTEPTGTLVDLKTGERTPQYGEREEWLSPSGALRIASGNHVTVRPPGKLSADEQQTYTGILDGYRDALVNGTAKLSKLEKFRGRDIYWVRFEGQTLFDLSDQRNHLWSYEVAIDAATYKPVYVRHARDGRPVPITGETIVLLETLPTGSIDFTPTPPRPPVGVLQGTVRVADISEQIGEDLPTHALGATPLWLGRTFGDLRLAYLQQQKLVWGLVESPEHVTGLEFCYGSTATVVVLRGHPEVMCDYSRAHLMLQEATKPSMNYRWPWSPDAPTARIPEEAVLVWGNEGLLTVDGVYVHIDAGSESEVLSAARALRPLDTGSQNDTAP
jgi:hypothetical protein